MRAAGVVAAINGLLASPLSIIMRGNERGLQRGAAFQFPGGSHGINASVDMMHSKLGDYIRRPGEPRLPGIHDPVYPAPQPNAKKRRSA